MSIKHKKQVFAEDGTDPNAVHPSDWNDEHAIDGLLALWAALTPLAGAFPIVAADGSGALAPISAPALAMLSKATTAAMLAAIGGVGPDSPNFTGVPIAPTATLGTNTDQIATMAALQAMRSDLTGGAPTLLDTLKELSDAIGADPNFAATITTALGNRLRVDAVQALTSAQKAQAIANLALATVAVSGSYNDLVNLPTLGTAASKNVGTSANQVVQLDGSAKLPAIDGSQLTNVAATSVVGALLYNASQALTDAQRLQALANLGSPWECGRLLYSNSTTLTYKPKKGDLLKVNGQVYRIPALGIVGLLNAGVYVNGVAGQNLAASTLYYIYAFVDATNGNALTADFSTTGHTTSSTAGNIGTEIKSADDTRSLIGMVYTNASAQFSDSLTASWFNRRTRNLPGAVTNPATPGGYFLEVGGGTSIASPGCRVYFLSWGDEGGCFVEVQADVSVTANNNVGASIAIDGSTSGYAQYTPYMNNANHNYVGASGAATLSEGLHYATFFGGSNGTGTTTYNNAQTIVSGVRG